MKTFIKNVSYNTFCSFYSLVIFLFITIQNTFAYSGSCSFVGSNTSYALQQTESLIQTLEVLKEKETCKIADRSIDSLTKASKYFSLYLKVKNYEQALIGYNAQIEQYQMTYDSATTNDEKAYWMEKLLEAKTNQIVTKAQVKLDKTSTQDEILQYSVEDLTTEIGKVVENTALLDECFMSKPELAANVISGVVNLAGGVASVATVNPIWGSVGNIIGGLISNLVSYIVKYKWEKYINKLDQQLIYHSFICMIEMQGNFYCEKKDEIDIIKKIMKRIESGGNYDNSNLWNGFEIEAKALPVVQDWIKTINRGLPPSSASEAEEQNELLSKINSAEMIQNQIVGKYKNLEETFSEGTGEKFNIIFTGVKEISALMGGNFPGERMGSGNDPSIPNWGQKYFTARFLSATIPFVLITPSNGDNFDNLPSKFPECSTNSCQPETLFKQYIKDNYGCGDEVDSVTLAKILSVVSNRIDYIFTKVNIDIDNDLNKRRIKDSDVLLSKAKNPLFPYKITAEKALSNIALYLDQSIDTLRKYLHYDGNEKICLAAKELINIEKYQIGIKNYKYNNKILKNLKQNDLKSGCPVELQLAYSTKQKVNEILFNLNNNDDTAKNRIINISSILKFSTDRTLFLMARMNEILKSDLNARTELGLFTPSEEEMMILREKDMILSLLEEQGSQTINYNQSIKERKSAQAIIRDNLKIFISFSVLNNKIATATSEIRTKCLSGKGTGNGSNREYCDKQGEICAILLSLPFNMTTGKNIYNACYTSWAQSEWNRTRIELGLDPIENLDIHFKNVYSSVAYPDRMCAYRNYQRQNVIYGIKKAKE
ncbi:MAG: hypothetical protein HQK51_08295 [Oligoflexia bacterium]|nr:hypothetical protein [Oligoflexia bacterium]